MNPIVNIIVYFFFNSIRKQYPSAFAYKSLCNAESTDKYHNTEVLNWQQSPLTSMDFDMRTFDAWAIFEPHLKQFLIENGIKSDLQHSPHGYHLIVSSLKVPFLGQWCRHFFKEHLLENRLWLDTLCSVKALDGMDVNGFTIYTEENWT